MAYRIRYLIDRLKTECFNKKKSRFFPFIPVWEKSDFFKYLWQIKQNYFFTLSYKNVQNKVVVTGEFCFFIYVFGLCPKKK